jgi:hypothetical protein
LVYKPAAKIGLGGGQKGEKTDFSLQHGLVKQIRASIGENQLRITPTNHFPHA